MPRALILQLVVVLVCACCTAHAQVNCEGCEYFVLPALVAAGEEVMDSVREVEVQFHHGQERRADFCRVIHSISQHYDVVYHYDFVWTRLRRRGWQSAAGGESGKQPAAGG